MTRPQSVAALGEREFDVLVIGGGITGAGVARDAALRGLSVALVDRHDFASGTSSRSSRLIHGGLRYLEHGYLRLVHESSTERRRLLRLAPHLVQPLAFTWPVYRGARVPRWKLRAGLFLYDALSMFRNVGRHRGLDVRELTALEPMLRADGLTGGATYYDAATDDSRLTLANAVDAREAGAVVLNHANVEGMIVERSKITGAEVLDVQSGARISVGARVVVNATGPWSDEVRSLAGDRASRGVRGSKGTHISVRSERVGNTGALTLLSPVDGRVFFVLPSGARTIIGTTDTFTDESPDGVRASEEDVAYLVRSANYFFPSAPLTVGDVEAAWAGLRPLVAASAGGGEGGASREHAITVGANGLVTISGGKLTTYRLMAEQVVDCVEQRLGRRPTHASTASRILPGGDFESLDEEVGNAAREWSERTARALVRAYGSRWRHVPSAAGASAAFVEDGLPYVVSQLAFAVDHEMACTLGDLLIRRTHVAFETSDHGMSAAARVARALKTQLGWGDERVARELDDYRFEVARMFNVR